MASGESTRRQCQVSTLSLYFNWSFRRQTCSGRSVGSQPPASVLHVLDLEKEAQHDSEDDLEDSHVPLSLIQAVNRDLTIDKDSARKLANRRSSGTYFSPASNSSSTKSSLAPQVAISARTDVVF